VGFDLVEVSLATVFAHAALAQPLKPASSFDGEQLEKWVGICVILCPWTQTIS
jgi:hypothetical protein